MRGILAQYDDVNADWAYRRRHESSKESSIGGSVS